MQVQVTKQHVRQLTQARKDLVKARALIEKPGAWIQHMLAETKEGKTSWPTYPNAACFCSRGAIMQAQRTDCQYDACESLAYAYLNHVFAPAKGNIEKHCEYVTVNNDRRSTTHQHVLMNFDLAILLVEDELEFAKSRVA